MWRLQDGVYEHRAPAPLSLLRVAGLRQLQPEPRQLQGERALPARGWLTCLSLVQMFTKAVRCCTVCWSRLKLLTDSNLITRKLTVCVPVSAPPFTWRCVQMTTDWLREWQTLLQPRVFRIALFGEHKVWRCVCVLAGEVMVAVAAGWQVQRVSPASVRFAEQLSSGGFALGCPDSVVQPRMQRAAGDL